MTALVAALSWHQPPFLLMLGIALLLAARRIGSKTTRALASALFALALLHTLAWLAYGQGPALHAFCTAVGLGISLPIALRSRRIYPLMVAAALLVSTLGMALQAFLSDDLAPAAAALAALANLVLLLAMAGAVAADWRWSIARRAASLSQP